MFAAGPENYTSGTPASMPDLPPIFAVSNRMQETLAAAARGLPPNRSLLTRADLLLAIAQGKGSGANFLRYALTMTTGADGSIYSPRSLNDLASRLRDWQGSGPLAEPAGGTLTGDGSTLLISASLRDVLAIARQYAAAQPIETGDIVAADASTPASILVPLLSAWGAEIAGAVLPRYAVADYVRRPDEFEDGAVAISFQKAPETAVPAGPMTAPALAPQPAPAGHRMLHDRLAEAKALPDRTVVRAALADDLVNALEQSNLAVLVTPRAYESDAAIRDLANLLAADDNGVLRYR